MTAKVKTKPKPLEEDDIRFFANDDDSILIPAYCVVAISIGVELKSQGQWSNNWRAAHGRRQRLRKRTADVLSLLPLYAAELHLKGKPARIEFTRMAPRRLDDDNLASVFKPIRDQVVAWLAGKNEPNARADDGMRSGYEFSYHQQQQKAYGVRIELACAE